MFRRPNRPRPPGLRRRLALGAVIGLLLAVPLVLLALAVRSEWAPVRRLDHAVANSLHEFVTAQPALLSTLNGIALGFHPWVFRIAVLVLVLVLVRRRALRLAWWAGVTMATASLLGPVVQLPLSRARPIFDVPVATAPGHSFPSLHAMNSAVGTLVFLLVLLPALPGVRTRVAAWCTGALVVLVTGFDRIALGVHYLSDVVAGWVAAAAIVAATAAAFETWRRDVGRPPHDPLAGVDPEDARRLE